MIHLIFPPMAPLVTFPELGMPRLLAYLKQHGVDARQHDLNIRAINTLPVDDPDHITQLKIWLRNQGRKGINRFSHSLGDIENGLRLIERTDADKLAHAIGERSADDVIIQLVRRASEVFLEVVPDEHTIDHLERSVRAGNKYLESFFGKTFFEKIEEEPPHLIGLSLASVEQLYPGLILSRMARELFPGCRTVIGGPWVSAARHLLEKLVAADLPLDYAVIFEGERPLLELSRVLAGEEKIDLVPSLVYRDRAGVARRTVLDPPVRLNELSTPDFTGIDFTEYPDRILPIQTTRHCAWGKCIFCYHREHSSAGSLEQRDPAIVVDRIEALIEATGIRNFYMADSSTELRLMVRVAEELMSRGVQIRWRAMTRSSGDWTRSAAALLSLAGLEALYIGLETAVPEKLEQIDKGITLEGLESDLACMSEAGIETHLFLLDYPTQTLGQLERTFRWVLARHPIITSFIAQKFELGRFARVFDHPELIGITVPEAASENLAVFHLPYTADQEVSREDFDEMNGRYLELFLRAKHGGGSPSPHPVNLGGDDRS